MVKKQSNTEDKFEVQVLEKADNPKGFIEFTHKGNIVRIKTTRLVFRPKRKTFPEKNGE